MKNSIIDGVILVVIFTAGIGLGLALSHSKEQRLKVKAVNTGHCRNCGSATRIIIMEADDVKRK